jgi:hypothetical protein
MQFKLGNISKIQEYCNNLYYNIKIVQLKHQNSDVFRPFLVCLPQDMCTSIYNLGFTQTLKYIAWGWPTERVEACRSSSLLFVKTLYCKIVRLLKYSLILTISARIRIAKVSKIVCKIKIYIKVNHAENK